MLLVCTSAPEEAGDGSAPLGVRPRSASANRVDFGHTGAGADGDGGVDSFTILSARSDLSGCVSPDCTMPSSALPYLVGCVAVWLCDICVHVCELLLSMVVNACLTC